MISVLFLTVCSNRSSWKVAEQIEQIEVEKITGSLYRYVWKDGQAQKKYHYG